jgi:hypothetical protein
MHRHLATRHLESAKQQLDANTQEALRYACLDLRMAIECLTYDLLALYRDDVLDETLAEWKADKILAALKKIDPTADSSPIFQMANDAGQFDADDTLTLKERRFQTKWAIKAYHTLGRHLHERTFIEIENGNVDDWEKVRDRTTAIASELQAIIDSSGWNLRLSRSFEVPCNCGKRAIFKLGPLQLRSRARCASCGAHYEVFRKHHTDEKIGTKVIRSGA